MLNLFWADMRQLKRTFLLLVLTLPLLHVIDNLLYPLALPMKVPVYDGSDIGWANEAYSEYSGWFFAMMASMILLLFSVESGAQSRLPSLLSLPLKRWQVAVLRYLPPLLIIPALGLILSVLRLALGTFEGLRGTDLWQKAQTTDWVNVKASFLWAFHNMTDMWGSGYAAFPLQIAGWIVIGLFISAIPLLVDDFWPRVKRSSFSLWLSVSLFIGIALQLVVFGTGKIFSLPMQPFWNSYLSKSSLSSRVSEWHPSLFTIEIVLTLTVVGLEIWAFQRRKSYV